MQGEVLYAYAGASERLTKQVKGLLNRLAEANLQSTVGQAAELLQSEGRHLVVQCLTDELLQVNFMSCAPSAMTQCHLPGQVCTHMVFIEE